MFRDRIIQWSRILSPSALASDTVGRLAGKYHSMICDKEDGTDRYRTQLNLDVSRAYIKLTQPPR